jgi:hypothetical protein
MDTSFAGLTKFNGTDFKKFEAPANFSSSKQMWRMYEVATRSSFYPHEIRSQKSTTTQFIIGKNPLEKNYRRMHVGPNGEVCFLFSGQHFSNNTSNENDRI